MTKPEIRMTNQKANANDESTAADAKPGDRIGFVIAVSPFFRHSDFGFRHSAVGDLESGGLSPAPCCAGHKAPRYSFFDLLTAVLCVLCG
jgi:hypothetical protein